jgi:hypothetical protein
MEIYDSLNIPTVLSYNFRDTDPHVCDHMPAHILRNSVPCLASNPWLRALGREIMDMRCGNLFTPLPLLCSVLPRPENLLVVITLFGSSEEFTPLKFGLGLVAKFCLGVYSGKAKRLRAGHMCYTCVLLVHM